MSCVRATSKEEKEGRGEEIRRSGIERLMNLNHWEYLSQGERN